MSRRELVRLFRGDKNRKKRQYVVAFFIIFIVGHISLLYLFISSSNSYLHFWRKVSPLPLAFVGNQIVSMSAFESELSLYRKIYSGIYKVDFKNGGSGYNDLGELRNFVLENMINRIIMKDLASKVGISVSDQEVRDVIGGLEKSIGGGGDDLYSIVRYVSGIESDELVKMVYYDLLEKKIKDKVLYQVNIERLAFAKKDYDLKEVGDILNSISSGESSFDDVKSLYQDDTDSNQFFNRWYVLSDLPDGIRSSIDELDSGEFSGVLESESSFFVVRLSGSRGYFKGGWSDLLKGQREAVSIRSFLK